MQLFGLSLSQFLYRFNTIFYVQYMYKNHIRILDKTNHSVILNCKVPFVLSKKCKTKLVTSLYIHIFKYECGLDYDKYDCEYYESVKNIITGFIKDVYIPRLNISANMNTISTTCALETCHNIFFKRTPSHYLNASVDKLIKLNDTFSYYNDISHSLHKSSIYCVQ